MNLNEADLPGQSLQKKKRFTKRLITVILLVLVVLLIGGCSTVFYLVACTPTSPLDINRYRGSSTSIDLSSEGPYSIQDDREWFDSCKEAIASRKSSYEKIFMSDPIITVEKEERIDALHFAVFDDKGEPFSEFVVYRFDKQDEKVSIQTRASYYALVDLDERVGGSYYYDTEVIKIAEYVNQSIKELSSSPTGLPFAYFEVSESPDIGEMTILGTHPDDVIAYTYEECTYYFWYYNDLPIQEYLMESSEFTFDGYTLRQMIEVLQIEAPERE